MKEKWSGWDFFVLFLAIVATLAIIAMGVILGNSLTEYQKQIQRTPNYIGRVTDINSPYSSGTVLITVGGQGKMILRATPECLDSLRVGSKIYQWANTSAIMLEYKEGKYC